MIAPMLIKMGLTVVEHLGQPAANMIDRLLRTPPHIAGSVLNLVYFGLALSAYRTELVALDGWTVAGVAFSAGFTLYEIRLMFAVASNSGSDIISRERRFLLMLVGLGVFGIPFDIGTSLINLERGLMIRNAVSTLGLAIGCADRPVRRERLTRLATVPT